MVSAETRKSHQKRRAQSAPFGYNNSCGGALRQLRAGLEDPKENEKEGRREKRQRIPVRCIGTGPKS